MIDDAWLELRQTVLDMAEGFAATDPFQASFYRHEAREFGWLDAPANERTLRAREEEAQFLRRVWANRLQRTRVR